MSNETLNLTFFCSKKKVTSWKVFVFGVFNHSICRMRENRDQKNSQYRDFSRNGYQRHFKTLRVLVVFFPEKPCVQKKYSVLMDVYNRLKYWELFFCFSPANICFLKVNNRNTRKRCKIWSKLTIVFLFLTLNK